jgi:hypothetical protein
MVSPWPMANHTTYTVNDARMVFVLPDRHRHEVLACKVDHPLSMCRVMDLIAAMKPYERRAVIVMATEFEMHNMYPQLHHELREPEATRLLDRNNEEDEG